MGWERIVTCLLGNFARAQSAMRFGHVGKPEILIATGVGLKSIIFPPLNVQNVD